MVTQGAAMEEVANSKLRRLLAYSTSFICADAQVGESVLFREAPNREGAPRWRGQEGILDVDGSGAAAEFQSQTWKVARYCGWK